MLRPGIIVFCAVLTACAGGQPGTGADASAAADADPGAPDAGPRADADIAAVQMYVHTRDTLYTIDDQDFTLSLIGTFDIAENITDLAVTPEGDLYGISGTALYRIDRVTADATRVADVSGDLNVGLTFLRDGTLLATDKSGAVREINTATGAATEIGSFGGGFATAGDLVAVADGTMYAISDEGPSGNEDTNNLLLTVNTATGAAVSVGGIGYGEVFGTAFANGKVYAFTTEGRVIEINRTTGAGTEVKSYPSIEFWGAGVTPLVQID